MPDQRLAQREDPSCCAGHACDHCAICRRGRCCRRDNPHYRLPAQGAWDGAIYGEIGRLHVMDGRIECHCCGAFFEALGPHIVRAHDLFAREYKAIFGLRLQTPLTCPRIRAAMRAPERLAHIRSVRPPIEEVSISAQLTSEQISARRIGRRWPREALDDPARVEHRQHERWWTPEKRRAMIERFLDDLGLTGATPEEIVAGVTFREVARAGLKQVIDSQFGGSIVAALQLVEPRITLEMWHKKPAGYWQSDRARAYVLTQLDAMLAANGLADAPLALIARQVTLQTLQDAGLGPALANRYGNSPYALLRERFPDLKPWQMRAVGPNFWAGDAGRQHRREAVLWLLTHLGVPDDAPPDAVRAALNWHTFEAWHLAVILHFYASYREALIDLIPERVLDERMPDDWSAFTGRAAPGYWDSSQAMIDADAAMRKMIHDEGLADAPPAAIGRMIVREVFVRHGLRPMLHKLFNGSIFAALQRLYPDLKPWQMTKAPQGYWTGPDGTRHMVDAIDWVQEQLGIPAMPLHLLRRRLRREALQERGLTGLIVTYGSHLRLLEAYAAARDGALLEAPKEGP